jgi:hypothetical protein
MPISMKIEFTYELKTCVKKDKNAGFVAEKGSPTTPVAQTRLIAQREREREGSKPFALIQSLFSFLFRETGMVSMR